MEHPDDLGKGRKKFKLSEILQGVYLASYGFFIACPTVVLQGHLISACSVRRRGRTFHRSVHFVATHPKFLKQIIFINLPLQGGEEPELTIFVPENYYFLQ